MNDVTEVKVVITHSADTTNTAQLYGLLKRGASDQALNVTKGEQVSLCDAEAAATESAVHCVSAVSHFSNVWRARRRKIAHCAHIEKVWRRRQ